MELIDKSAVAAKIESIVNETNYEPFTDEVLGKRKACEDIKDFLDTLEVKDPYEQRIQYPSVKDGIEDHAETYSFNIESQLFNQLTKEQQELWRKEIEQACISGGHWGVTLARDKRYEENREPLSEDLREASKNYALNNTPWDDCINEMQESFKAGAKWQKANLWKSADGDDLPDIDREVVALLDNGKVVFAHRPPEYWDGKDIATGKVTRYYPKTYDNRGWNIPNVKYWLDVKLPKEIEL